MTSTKVKAESKINLEKLFYVLFLSAPQCFCYFPDNTVRLRPNLVKITTNTTEFRNQYNLVVISRFSQV